MKKQAIKRQRELEATQWVLNSDDRNAINPHHGYETPKHLLVKAEIGRQAANNKITFFSEASNEQGKVCDLLLLREENHEMGLVIELESDYTQEDVTSKIDDFLGPMVQDVIVLDPQKAPVRLDDLTPWIEEKLNGFL